MNISTELLAAITGDINIIPEYTKVENNKILYRTRTYSDPALLKTIPIFDFMYLCKDWAFENGYSISSGFRFSNGAIRATVYKLDTENYYTSNYSECQAIINCADWILSKVTK